jgi:sulfur-carrier protein adenylyltransferase/sulfurtransferase
LASVSALHPDQLRRYARQVLLPEIGIQGQAALRRARVLLVGAGGLGSPAGQYLAAAGVGRLGLVEFDHVDESNLHRQLLYSHDDIGRSKIEVAMERLRTLQPDIELEPHETALDARNARALVRSHDVVLDGTDNFSARYAVNDACVLERVPNVYGAVLRFEGQVSVFAHADGPCYRCLFPEPPEAGSIPSCAEAGVLGVLPGVIGTLQATEALKLLVGVGEPLVGRMVTYDALRARFREVALRQDPNCPICGDDPSILDVEDVISGCEVSAAGESGAAEIDETRHEIQVETLHARFVAKTAPPILDVRSAEEIAIARLPGESVHIPLHLLPLRWEELDPEQEYAVLCHQGVRSRSAVQFLQERGFGRARDVVGGIDRWSQLVDPSVPRY